MLEEIHRTTHTSLYVDRQSTLVKGEYRGFNGNFQELQDHGKAAKKAIKDHKALGYLTDVREAAVLTPDNRDYLIGDFIPRIIQAGAKKAATLLPNELFADASMKKLMKDAEERYNFEHRFFQSEDEAINWLQGQSKAAESN